MRNMTDFLGRCFSQEEDFLRSGVATSDSGAEKGSVERSGLVRTPAKEMPQGT